MQVYPKAKLILEDGSVYSGYSFGSQTSKDGEVVFTTGMVGYPESLTDPSFCGQILVCTYPLIGNYGVPTEENNQNQSNKSISTYFESEKIQVQGLIVSEYSDTSYHWQAAKTLSQWLKEQNVPAICGIDTRALTKKLREKGVMLGRIVLEHARKDNSTISPINTSHSISSFLSQHSSHSAHDPSLFTFEDPNHQNLVAKVSCQKKILYLPKAPSSSSQHSSQHSSTSQNTNLKIIMVDCGVKNNIIREFLQRDITVLRVPWDYDFTKEQYDGVFISNGPGDPTQCHATITNIQKALTQSKPILGICLGSQIMALAAGAKTYKLKYGHRGQNQPCINTTTQRCYITSQNHGYAVDEKTLHPDWEAFLTNANDDSNEGIRHKTKPFFAVQFHPEATPGPTDTQFFFDEFIESILKSKEILTSKEKVHHD